MVGLAQVVADGLEIAAPPGRARQEARVGAGRIYAVAESQSRTTAIGTSPATRAGAWPTPGMSTTLAAGPWRCISAAVSGSSRSDSAPCSTRTGQRMASHTGQRSTSLEAVGAEGLADGGIVGEAEAAALEPAIALEGEVAPILIAHRPERRVHAAQVGLQLVERGEARIGADILGDALERDLRDVGADVVQRRGGGWACSAAPPAACR